MQEYSMVRFFNQFVHIIRTNRIKNMGIITDKDGTLLLNDELLKALDSLKRADLGVNIPIIVNSGRTKSDAEECLKKSKILDYIDYIVGDNRRNML